MSLALATKGMIGGHLATSGEGYPVAVEEVEIDTDLIDGPFVDATADVASVTLSADGSEILPSIIKIEGMERNKPRFNTFPSPTNL